jgi:hypothetical protein
LGLLSINMDKLLLKAIPPASNGTQPTNLDFTPNVLNTLIPGYSIISHYASTYLGIDISLFVIAGALILGATKGGKYLFDQLEAAFRYLFLSSVYIEEEDDLFDMVMTWLDARETTSRHRNLRAKTPRGSQLDDDDDDVTSTSPSEASRRPASSTTRNGPPAPRRATNPTTAATCSGTPASLSSSAAPAAHRTKA